jgi:hypothetical protein
LEKMKLNGRYPGRYVENSLIFLISKLW